MRETLVILHIPRAIDAPDYLLRQPHGNQMPNMLRPAASCLVGILQDGQAQGGVSPQQTGNAPSAMTQPLSSASH